MKWISVIKGDLDATGITQADITDKKIVWQNLFHWEVESNTILRRKCIGEAQEDGRAQFVLLRRRRAHPVEEKEAGVA